MSSETPGIGGVPGIKPPNTRAFVAYAKLNRGLHKDVPEALRTSRETRRILNRLFRIPKKR